MNLAKKTMRILIAFSPALSLWCALVSPAAAGGGPENVFLVVNPQSPASLAIANHYIQLRQIPPGNVFYLPWNPQQVDATVIATFRAAILSPIIDAIRQRRLMGQIDYIVYSSDFPWRIFYNTDLDKFKDLLAPVRDSSSDKDDKNPSSPRDKPVIFPQSIPTASLSGLTYLWQSVLKEEVDYLDLHANRYIRLPIAEQEDKPTLGFHSAWQFGRRGELVQAQGKSYMLSVMLGVTWGRGNSVEEVLQYLKRSATADGIHPPGTIYFVKNSDIRSTVRHDLFPDAVKKLEKLGVSAQIIKGIVPLNKNDVQGAVMGTGDFDWKASGSTILPGAICDNFTSYGGVMFLNIQQTPLSEFLRYGAAGTCGTVDEPFRILEKFPLPMLQVHYARGCTMAEAFYQSIFGPYQILIVGDPLCRPWANIPKVSVSGVKPNYTVKGTIILTPTGSTPSGQKIDHFELFVNGSRATHCKPGETLTLDTTLLPDGNHELRVVAVEAGLIQSQGRVIIPIVTDNHERKIAVNVASPGVIRPDNPLLINVNSPGSSSFSVLQNSRIVGRLSGEKGQIKIEAADLGAGPVRLQVIGLGREGPRTHVVSPPIDVRVEIPEKKEVAEPK